jgi:RNA polymerase sigma-70 factor (ECF subfamily)
MTICRNNVEAAQHAPSTVQILVREADIGAARVARAFNLARHDREDIHHDLLIDLLDRVRSFDPARGALGAFAGAIVRHRISSIAKRLHRERNLFVAGLEHCAQWFGARDSDHASVDELAKIDLNLDLRRVLFKLSAGERALCFRLAHDDATQVVRSTGRSRASIHRDIMKLRTRFAQFGVFARVQHGADMFGLEGPKR